MPLALTKKEPTAPEGGTRPSCSPLRGGQEGPGPSLPKRLRKDWRSVHPQRITPTAQSVELRRAGAGSPGTPYETALCMQEDLAQTWLASNEKGAPQRDLGPLGLLGRRGFACLRLGIEGTP